MCRLFYVRRNLRSILDHFLLLFHAYCTMIKVQVGIGALHERRTSPAGNVTETNGNSGSLLNSREILPSAMLPGNKSQYRVT